MVWGIDKDELVLVKNSDTKRRLVFDQLKPSYENVKFITLAPKSHPGIGIVLTGKT